MGVQPEDMTEEERPVNLCDLCGRHVHKTPLFDSATRKIFKLCKTHRATMLRYVGFKPMDESRVKR